MDKNKKKWDHHRELKDLFESDNLIERQKSVYSKLVYGNGDVPRRKISIIITNYNRHERFYNALQSATNQSVGIDVYNIVVVDDSRDDIEKSEALKAVRSLDKGNIWYYRNTERLGLFGNMNRGATISNSEWICFLHNDDILYDDAIERMLEAINEIADKKTASIYPTHDFILENGNIVQTNMEVINRPIYKWLVNKDHNMVKKRGFEKLVYGDDERCVAPSCGALFRRKPFIEYGGYGEGYGSGDMLLLYGLCKDYSCYIINEAWGAFRWESNESLNQETIAAYIEERHLLMDYFRKYYRKSLIQRVDLSVQYKTFYFNIIKKYYGNKSEDETLEFIKMYLPEYLEFSRSRITYYVNRVREYIIDKHRIIYNILHSRKLPYAVRIR